MIFAHCCTLLQVFPKGSPLVPDVSRAVLKVMEGENMTRFERELYGDGCSDQDANTETQSSLRVSSFWGLFVITGSVSFLALMIYLALFLYEHRDLLRKHDPGNSVRRHRLSSLAKVYDQKDFDRAPPKSPEIIERPPVGDINLSPFSISGPPSPSSTLNRGDDSFEIEEGTETSSDEEGTPGREISNQNPDPYSFSEMVTERSVNALQ